MELNKIIRKLRGETSQADFGNRFGVSRQAVSQWENGDTQPSSEVLEKLGIKIVYKQSSAA